VAIEQDCFFLLSAFTLSQGDSPDNGATRFYPCRHADIRIERTNYLSRELDSLLRIVTVKENNACSVRVSDILIGIALIAEKVVCRFGMERKKLLTAIERNLVQREVNIDILKLLNLRGVLWQASHNPNDNLRRFASNNVKSLYGFSE
jgi:hypothetical protein